MEINLKDRTITLQSSDFLTVREGGRSTGEAVHVARIVIQCPNCGGWAAWSLLLSNLEAPITWLDMSQRNSQNPTILDLKADTLNSHECPRARE